MSSLHHLVASLLDQDLSARERAIRAGIAALVVGLALGGLYWSGHGDVADELDLRGSLVTLLVIALGLTRTARRHSQRPSSSGSQGEREASQKVYHQPVPPVLREPTDPSWPTFVDLSEYAEPDDRPTNPGRRRDP